jgi:uncharacterized delta-60 repeat protein
MRRIVWGAALLICLAFAAVAGATTLDRGFGDGGVVMTGFGSHLDLRAHTASEVEVEPSGRVVLGIGGPRGTFTVERVTATGALDPGFGSGGAVTTAINGRAVAVSPGGSVVVAGSTGAGNPGRDIAVSRYDADGKLDRSFGRGGTYSLDASREDFAEAVALQPDGTIVVAGQATCPAHTPGCGYYGSSKLVLLRLSPSGRLLSRTDYKLAEAEIGMAVAGDGRILVITESAGRNHPPRLIAFTPGGKLETAFGSNGAAAVGGNPETGSFTVAADGDLLYTAYSAQGYYVHRFLPDGSPDPSFGGSGSIRCVPTPNDINNGESAARVAALPDGGVLTSGGPADCALARFLPDGSPDLGFAGIGRVEASAAVGGDVQDVAAGPGETALVLRWQTGVGFRLARYTVAGALDPSFGDGGVATVTAKASTFDQVNALVPLPKGKLLAVGTSQCGDWSCGEFALARYLRGGRLDRSFGEGGRVTTPFEGEGLATSAAIQRGGRIVVGGAVGTRAYGELHSTSPTLARYKPDGALDTGFGRDGIVTVPSAKGEDAQWNGVAIAPDGDIVAVGEASCTQGGKRECGKRYCSECGTYVAARFHPGGALDRSFGKGGVERIDVGHNNEDHDAGRAVAVEPDGKILIAGHSYLGGFGIVRLLPDGRRDPTFGHGGIVKTYFSILLHEKGAKPVAFEVGRPGYALALLPSGKFLVAGGSETPKHEGYGHPTNHGVVVRYLPDGKIDPTFGDGSLTEIGDLAIRALTVDGCGRPVVAGAYSRASKTTSFGAARLLPSGAVDHSFTKGVGHLTLGSGQESRANAIAVGGNDVILGGVASNDGAGDDFALAALHAGRSCHR